MPVQIDRAVGAFSQLDPLDKLIVLPHLGIQLVTRYAERQHRRDRRRQRQHHADDDKITPFEFTAHGYILFLRRGR